MQKKINLEKPLLTPVVKAENNKYYLLRTEKAIFAETKSIALSKNGADIGTITLQKPEPQNIKKAKTINLLIN